MYKLKIRTVDEDIKRTRTNGTGEGELLNVDQPSEHQRQLDPRPRAAGYPVAACRFWASAWPSTTAAATSKPASGRDYPNFVDCTMFGNHAEKHGPHPAQGHESGHRGQAALFELGQGRPAPIQAFEVIVDEIEFMSQKQAPAAPQGYQQQYAPQPAPQAAPQQWNAQQAYQQAPGGTAGYQQQYAPQPAPQAAPQAPMPPAQESLYDGDIPF